MTFLWMSVLSLVLLLATTILAIATIVRHRVNFEKENLEHYDGK